MEDKSQPLWVVALKILIAVLLPNVGGLVGANFSTISLDNWYPTLQKPNWTPPNWLFVPMWVFLYTLIGVASYLVYRAGRGFRGPAKWYLLFYIANLILNWSWSLVFFYGQNIFGGFVLITIILATAIIEAGMFGNISWIAGTLILPYVAWLVVATALNGWIYLNNY